MVRPLLGIAFIILLVITAGVVVADEASQRDTFAEVVVGDLVIGEDEQRIGPMRVVEIDEDVEEVVVEIDVTVLEKHGVDIGHAEADLTDDDVRGASVVSTSVEDGVITLVLGPDDSVIEIEQFQLTHLDTEDAEATSDLTFDVTLSNSDADGYSFDIINPNEVTPTVAPDTLYTGFGEHQVRVEGIQPVDGTVTIEFDTTVLEAHGVTVGDLEAEVDTEEATVHETTIEKGVVTVILAPVNNTALFDTRVHLREFGTRAVDTDERVAAASVAYEVRIEGDSTDNVDIERFDLVSGYLTPQTDEANTTTRETTRHEDERTAWEGTQANDETGSISEEVPGSGIVVAIIAFVVSGLLIVRRK